MKRAQSFEFISDNIIIGFTSGAGLCIIDRANAEKSKTKRTNDGVTVLRGVVEYGESSCRSKLGR